MWSDVDILNGLENNSIKMLNFDVKCLRPSSYVLRIGDIILEDTGIDGVIDTLFTDTRNIFKTNTMDEKGFCIKPNKMYLASSFELLTLSDNVTAFLSQRSSLARIGLSINYSSNFVCATYGQSSPSSLTFELFNNSNRDIIIYPKLKVCHIRFCTQQSKSKLNYNGVFDNTLIPKATNFNQIKI